MNQLIFQGPICETGYGIVATNQLYELDKQGKNIVLIPKGRNVEAHPKYHEVIKRTAANIEHLCLDSPFLKIWHQFELLERIGRGKYIGYPIFEMDRMTSYEQLNLRACDQVLVCSKWAQQVLAGHEIKSDVVPLGVDLDVFKPRAYKPERQNFVFANFGKWEIRKGHDILLSAFNKAFSPTDNVELWMVSQNFLLDKVANDEWNNAYMNSPMGRAGKIKLFPRQESQDQVANIMQMVDCGVFPARAEGWNLEALELMACGTPSVVTDYAGHTEFCNHKNSFLIPVQEMEVAYDGKWFQPGQNANQGQWAWLEEDTFIITMREVAKKGWKRDNEECLKTAKKYTWSNCARTLSEITGI